MKGNAWAREVVTAIRNIYSGRMPFPSWSKLYDRAFFGQIRFLPGRYADDTHWTPMTHFAKGMLRAAIRWPFRPRLRLWLLAHRQRTLLYLISLRQARKA